MLGATSIWLWFALLMTCTHAAIDPLYGWTIDDSCQPWIENLRTAFGGAADLTRVALEKLDIIRKTRAPVGSYEYDQWNFIDQNLLLSFGFDNDPDIEYNSDRDPYWRDVYENFNAIHTSFVDAVVSPPGGFLGLPGGPTIFCDSRSWVWFKVEDVDPTDPGKGLLKDTKLGQWDMPDAAGAWYYKGRFIPERKQSNVVPTCADGNLAVAEMKVDGIQICFDRQALPTMPPDEVFGGEDLNTIRLNLAYLLVHELTHWYSTDQENVEETEVIDQACLDMNGERLFIDPNNPQSPAVPESQVWPDSGLMLLKAYGPSCVFTLAHFNIDEAVTNADSYALFALMVKYDEISWNTGFAVDYYSGGGNDEGSGGSDDPDWSDGS